MGTTWAQRLLGWRWPLPALLTWVVAWLLYLGARPGLGAWALPLASALGLGLAWGAARRSQALWLALGFPLSALLLHGAALPAWGWLLPLAVLLALYPLRAWHDAPLFPTPIDALKSLPDHIQLAQDALVLDAGCGLGDGLRALHRVYPQVRLHGLEWSWPLRLLCALRCPWARVRQGDMWATPWSEYQLVYLFQRPESMARAAEKACAELAPGAWLVSLEFEATTLKPHACLRTPAGKPLWVYRMPALPQPTSAPSPGANRRDQGRRKRGA
ncbi:MAG: hypothetical protein OHK0048_22840 [Rhodoferax sp.]